jgi:CubicO group peptidase (beta-lactamase class C family)
MYLPSARKFRSADAVRSWGSLPMQSIPHFCLLLVGVVLGLATPTHSADTPRTGLGQAAPPTIGLLASRLKQIDNAVTASIEAREIPGAVVLVARHGKVAYLKAFGNRAIQPNPEIMTVDTIFDISSLTKVTATLPCVMLLVENGSLRIEDRVKRYLPNFSGGGKDSITVRQLLTHYSGLAPDFDLSKGWSGRAAALEELWREKTQSEPGKEFVYSDLNFIALEEIVRAVSGKTLDVLAQEQIFGPLGMKETCFRPPANLLPRIAPTEPRKNTLQYLKGQPTESSDTMVRGEVHDPTAWRMGGIAGHAGLFSSAQDLAVYAQMILGGGTYQGTRILSRMTVDAMTRAQSPPGMLQVRGFGWDLDSSYSAPRGDLFRGGFGHSGFTGTSLWIHPPSDTFVIVLSNRVHPGGGKDINHLRGVIANIVAAAVMD